MCGMHVQVGVFGVFTRALRDADVRRCEEHMKRRPKEKQGIVPDLLIGTNLFELKGIRSDSTHTNCNGAAVTEEINIPLEIQKRVIVKPLGIRAV
jgi:hypothetical protein